MNYLRSCSKTDASSYIPDENSVFGSVRRRLSGKNFERSLSSPDYDHMSQQSGTTTPRPSRLASSLDYCQPRNMKFVPKVNTIHGSTGDLLSKDDMNLSQVHRTGKVEDLAKNIDLVLQSKRHASVSGIRHGSAGDVNRLSNMVRNGVMCIGTLYCEYLVISL